MTPGEYAVRHSKNSGPSFGRDLYFSYNGNEFDAIESNLDNIGQSFGVNKTEPGHLCCNQRSPSELFTLPFDNPCSPNDSACISKSAL